MIPDKKNWNLLNIEKIKNNDQTEITRMYKLTRPYMLKFFNNNEELYNDWIIKIITKINNFNPNTGAFYTYIQKIAENLKKDHIKRENRVRQIKTCSYDNPLDILIGKDIFENKTFNSNEFLDANNQQIEYEFITQEDKEQLHYQLNHILLPSLSDNDYFFIIDYTSNNIDKTPNQHTRYNRILNRLRNQVRN